jgi:hypothetical protein
MQVLSSSCKSCQKATELLGDMVCSANQFLYYWLWLLWISYPTVRGALLCSCWLFAPRSSAIDSLQECSSLFEERKGGAAFAGYAAGRWLHIFPTSIVTCTSPICLLYWLGTCVNFIPNSEGSVALFLLVVCPSLFLQLIVCRSAVHCLKSQRVALLLQDMWWEGAFVCTHTSIVACTSPICLLYWLGTCVNFIPNSEGSIALFLSVVCPTLFCNR